MKTNKKSRFSDLSVDVVEYLFIEWLVRRNLFSVYKANYEAFHPNHRPFRDNLRTKIRATCRSRVPTIGIIISTSFPFAMTPEGYNFWVDQSNHWNHFCDKFKAIL
nr:MAG TPA: hypothetical protein [Microviridae sp.]